MKKAYLLLADGTLFEGVSVGAEGKCIAEVVFHTGMAGYQDVLNDPSYYGQAVCMTYPLIGGFGVTAEDFASSKSCVSGFIVRELCDYPSNWRCEHTLDEFLKKEGVIGLAGIDTRHLTRVIRSKGVMNGILYTEGYEPDEQMIADMKAYKIADAVKAVTVSEPIVCAAKDEQKYRVALLDCGAKKDIIDILTARGCEVTRLPAMTDAQTIVDGGYDGAVISNGPGDPTENTAIVENIKALVASGIPMFGIALGHQLIAMAFGATITKLPFGHHGVNQPVKELSTGRTRITSQNHGYAVDGDSINAELGRVSHIHINDQACEGIEHVSAPIFSVQYYPENEPGPQDTIDPYGHFIALMDEKKGGAQ